MTAKDRLEYWREERRQIEQHLSTAPPFVRDIVERDLEQADRFIAYWERRVAEAGDTFPPAPP